MVDQQDVEISRREFLRLGGILPLGLLINSSGLISALTSGEAEARIKSQKIINQRTSHPQRETSRQMHEKKAVKISKDNNNRHRHHERISKNVPHKKKLHKVARRNSRHRVASRRNYQRNHYDIEYQQVEYQELDFYQERKLHLYNIHTDERVNTVYWAEGHYIAEGLRELNYFMRDHYTGDIVSIDPRLFDLLYSLCGLTEYDKPFHVLSAYRCLATNNMLRELGGTVASHSLHMDGMAVDLRAPGLRTGYLRKAAVNMQYGGVGYYPYSDFVHVDTGPIRQW